MGSLASDTKTLQVRLTRKVVRDFVEHDVLPDPNGLVRTSTNSNKFTHDSKIRGECYFHAVYFWANGESTTVSHALNHLNMDLV